MSDAKKTPGAAKSINVTSDDGATDTANKGVIVPSRPMLKNPALSTLADAAVPESDAPPTAPTLKKAASKPVVKPLESSPDAATTEAQAEDDTAASPGTPNTATKAEPEASAEKPTDTAPKQDENKDAA